MLILFKQSLKYSISCMLCVLTIKTATADYIKITNSTYNVLYAYSGKINTENNDGYLADENGFLDGNDNEAQFSNGVVDVDKIHDIKQNNNQNQYKDVFTFAGISFGMTGLGLYAGGNYKMFGVRFSAQTLQINSPLKINTNVRVKLFNEGDYGVDFMLRPTSYFHVDVGFHYFKNIVSVYYSDKVLASKIGLNGLIVGGDVDVKLGGGIVPYIGFGFNIRLFSQIYLDIDFGLIFTGDYKIKTFSVYISDMAGNRESVDVNPSYKDIKYITNYNAEKHNYKVWPVAKIGFSYRYNL